MIEDYRNTLREMIARLEQEYGVSEAFPVTRPLTQAHDQLRIVEWRSRGNPTSAAEAGSKVGQLAPAIDIMEALRKSLAEANSAKAEQRKAI